MSTRRVSGEAPGARSTFAAAHARRREPPPTEQPRWLPPPRYGLTLRAESHRNKGKKKKADAASSRREADAETKKRTPEMNTSFAGLDDSCMGN